jgi:mitochondrial fission protein ELM1
LQVVADGLPWPYQVKRIYVREPFVFGKPSIEASLHHVDAERSDPLEGPWPDLVITSGRRMSMVALWVKAQAANRTKIVLVGLPKGQIQQFDLAVAAEHYRPLKRDNLLRIKYPLQRADTRLIAAEADHWREEFEKLPRPLTAVMIGGATGAVRFDAATATALADDLARLAARDGGTLVVTTSRRTPPDVVAVLEAKLPRGTVLHRWSPDGKSNPYQALLGLADRFVVTSDSLSMALEIARVGRPLAIYRMPMPPMLGSEFLSKLVHSLPFVEALGVKLGMAASRFGLGHQRDLTVIHRLLVEEGCAVWFGAPFPSAGRPPIDDLPKVVARIVSLMDGT